MSRTVRVGVCPTCHAKTLTGLNRNVLAFDTTLDHAPVDNLGEALALLTGRLTYDLRPNSGRNHGRVMEERTADRIAQPHRFHPIHAEHRCHQPLPTAPPNAAAHQDVTIDTDSELPF